MVQIPHVALVCFSPRKTQWNVAGYCVSSLSIISVYKWHPSCLLVHIAFTVTLVLNHLPSPPPGACRSICVWLRYRLSNPSDVQLREDHPPRALTSSRPEQLHAPLVLEQSACRREGWGGEGRAASGSCCLETSQESRNIFFPPHEHCKCVTVTDDWTTAPRLFFSLF